MQELVFIEPSQSKYWYNIKDRLSSYPIGVLHDIEIHFLHYSSPKEAYEKWSRRLARFNIENIIIKFSEAEKKNVFYIEKFQKLSFKNKICFTRFGYSSS